MNNLLTSKLKRGTLGLIVALVILAATPVLAQFNDSGQVNNEYQRTEGLLMNWADDVVDYTRGFQDYAQPELGYVSNGEPTDILGSTGTPFSLGDGGSITVTFPTTIVNNQGDDFVVFENGFVWQGVFMELGFVEVSSDGIIFSRFPSLCRRETQPGAWDTSDPALFYNLAGNFEGGTGFDLDDLMLSGDANVLSGSVQLNAITHVRVVDVVGDISGSGATFDFLGRAVADPYPTASTSSGMDITGIAVLNIGTVAVKEATWSHVKSLYR